MPKSASHDVAARLRQRILAGEWRAGRLPPERDLAQEFGIARNTLRKAFDTLERDGMLVRRVGHGTFVINPEVDTLAATVARMEGASPADMMEVRLLLEPAAAGFAATNASGSELAAVREAHEAACAADPMPAFEHWDAELHHRIFACCRNEFLKDIHNLMRILRNQAPWFEMKRRSFTDERRRLYCEQHAAILDALVARDPAAAHETMHRHLKTVEDNLLGRS